MSGRLARRLLLVVGVVGAGALLVVALLDLPGLGQVPHPYTQRAVAAALSHDTANVVASVTFDLRGLDTLGEEYILFAAAVAALMLLRTMRDEDEDRAPHHYGPEDVWSGVHLLGFALLAPTLLVGAYVVVHGHVSPGGGFQGGALLATGIHLAYLAGDYRALERLRPKALFDVAEAVGAAGFVLLGLSSVLLADPFLTNWLDTGALGTTMSAGLVGFFNVAVGMEVASALVMLIAKFLEQALLVERTR